MNPIIKYLIVFVVGGGVAIGIETNTIQNLISGGHVTQIVTFFVAVYTAWQEFRDHHKIEDAFKKKKLTS